MTDKQIICKCNDKECEQCSFEEQLKAKEQECEELKSYYELYRQGQELIKKVHAVVNSHPNYGIELSENGYIDKDERLSFLEIDKQIELIFNEQSQQLDQLKAENKTQKETIDGFLSILDKLGKSNIKLRETLTEIKEIAEICKCHNTDGCYECKYFDDCEVEGEEIPTRDVCKLILQKISECEGNDEM